MAEKYVPVDGVATFVQYAGPTGLPEAAPDLSRGETVLCLHGVRGNGSVFEPLFERLAPAHSPVAFDLPAHARSGGLDSLASIEAMARFTGALAERLGISSAVLLGHSMGGAVALECALARPGAVRGLVLLGAAPRFDVPDSHLDQVRRVTEGKERSRITRDAYSPAASREVVQRGIMEDLKTDPRAEYGDLAALRDWSAEERLGSVPVPTLVVVGADDPDAGAAERLAGGIPGARKVTIEKAGRMAHLEQPHAVADAVLGFLAELGR